VRRASKTGKILKLPIHYRRIKKAVNGTVIHNLLISSQPLSFNFHVSV
jgi:hypothetical protein